MRCVTACACDIKHITLNALTHFKSHGAYLNDDVCEVGLVAVVRLSPDVAAHVVVGQGQVEGHLAGDGLHARVRTGAVVHLGGKCIKRLLTVQTYETWSALIRAQHDFIIVMER